MLAPNVALAGAAKVSWEPLGGGVLYRPVECKLGRGHPRSRADTVVQCICNQIFRPSTRLYCSSLGR